MKRRVVVTGVGAVTPIGNDVKTVWESQQACRNGVGPITHFDASEFPTKFAAEVRDYDFESRISNADRFVDAGRNSRFALGAAAEAVADSGFQDSNNFNPARFGIYLGAGEGQQHFLQFMSLVAEASRSGEVDVSNFTESFICRMNPRYELELEPNMPAAHLSSVFNAQGPNLNCLTACAASSQAIGEATEIIRRSDADVMLSGGAHSMIHPFGVSGFNLLTALSERNDSPQTASRPFDLNRDGFVLGEGAGMLILEELEHAKARGAKIYGEIRGYGSTADAYRITDIHPQGRGAINCIRMALADAKINREEIGYVNAHGTSTRVNDQVETMAIKGGLGEHAYKTPVSSIKSMMGHLIAAAGAVEAITCLLAIRDGVLPATINYETPDPDCDLDYIPNQPREKKLTAALSNSFGFGGQNVALIIAAYRD
jgi:3-oxoacyl-[acyl-carrier-protein] synthase II